MWRPSSSPVRARKSESTPASPPLSSRSTLTEVLRINQFRVNNGSSPALLIREEREDEAVALNQDLAVLANIFPDVKYDCLRELLTRFNGDSRLEICTEQLYRYKDEWTRGRTQVPPRDEDEPTPVEEHFRTEQYRLACARLLYKEFGSLNRSAVDAVLAEVNHNYTQARPVLQEIVNKSWRATIQSLFRKKKDKNLLPTFLYEKGKIGQRLMPTSSKELDQELDTLFLKPARDQAALTREGQDRIVAVLLNEGEAEAAQALFECQICYGDVPFENISACSDDSHVVCLDCVKKSLSECIFGQNWSQSVDPNLGTLRCLAPTDPRCSGHIPSLQLKQAILQKQSGQELWNRFEDRLAEKAMFESRLPLVRCPSCSYAEAETVYDSTDDSQPINWAFRPMPVHYKIFAILACEFLLPTLLFVYLTLRVLTPSFLPSLFNTSLSHFAANQRTTRFRCQNPHCRRRSCLKCQKPWHDPHTCHEPLLLSLRQSVEAARTAAVKRVCPRCSTAFVKSSGCNKLTCVCGYSMCYLCRRNIGKTGENEGAEGYRHFCEHFRPVMGQKCTQCDKCDLYKTEEEDILVRRAGEEAERDWREKNVKEGGVGKGVECIKIDHDGLVGRMNVWERFINGYWTVQGIVDAVVAQIIVVHI